MKNMTREEMDEEELETLASGWIEIHHMGVDYQHFQNKDGRERWRLKAKPEDDEPGPWHKGKPGQTEDGKK